MNEFSLAESINNRSLLTNDGVDELPVNDNNEPNSSSLIYNLISTPKSDYNLPLLTCPPPNVDAASAIRSDDSMERPESASSLSPIRKKARFRMNDIHSNSNHPATPTGSTTDNEVMDVDSTMSRSRDIPPSSNRSMLESNDNIYQDTSPSSQKRHVNPKYEFILATPDQVNMSTSPIGGSSNTKGAVSTHLLHSTTSTACHNTTVTFASLPNVAKTIRPQQNEMFEHDNDDDDNDFDSEVVSSQLFQPFSSQQKQSRDDNIQNRDFDVSATCFRPVMHGVDEDSNNHTPSSMTRREETMTNSRSSSSSSSSSSGCLNFKLAPRRSSNQIDSIDFERWE
jgi:hypothetical protein